MAGPDARDPLSMGGPVPDFLTACEGDLKGLRVVWSADFGYAPVDAEVRHIAEAAAKHLTPVLMELGGQDAAIVCDDANLDTAASGVLWGAFLNSGQTCSALTPVW